MSDPQLHACPECNSIGTTGKSGRAKCSKCGHKLTAEERKKIKAKDSKKTKTTRTQSKEALGQLCESCGAAGTTGKYGLGHCSKCGKQKNKGSKEYRTEAGCMIFFVCCIAVFGVIGLLSLAVDCNSAIPSGNPSSTSNPLVPFGALGIPLLMMIAMLLAKKK
jgi:hypothetical protein